MSIYPSARTSDESTYFSKHGDRLHQSQQSLSSAPRQMTSMGAMTRPTQEQYRANAIRDASRLEHASMANRAMHRSHHSLSESSNGINESTMARSNVQHASDQTGSMQLTGSKTGHLPGGRLSPDYQRIAAATLSMKGTGRSLSDKTQQSRRGDSNVTNFGRTMPNVVSNGRMDKLVTDRYPTDDGLMSSSTRLASQKMPTHLSGRLPANGQISHNYRGQQEVSLPNDRYAEAVEREGVQSSRYRTPKGLTESISGFSTYASPYSQDTVSSSAARARGQSAYRGPSVETRKAAVVLECTICGVDATGPWRRGPLGPYSLCNACGSLPWLEETDGTVANIHEALSLMDNMRLTRLNSLPASPPMCTPAEIALQQRLLNGLPDSTYSRAEEYFATRSANYRRSEFAKAELQRVEREKEAANREQRQVLSRGAGRTAVGAERDYAITYNPLSSHQSKRQTDVRDISLKMLAMQQEREKARSQLQDNRNISREALNAHEAEIEIERQRMREHIRREKEKSRQRDLELAALAARTTPPHATPSGALLTAMPNLPLSVSPSSKFQDGPHRNVHASPSIRHTKTDSSSSALLEAATLMTSFAEESIVATQPIAGVPSSQRREESRTSNPVVRSHGSYIRASPAAAEVRSSETVSRISSQPSKSEMAAERDSAPTQLSRSPPVASQKGHTRTHSNMTKTSTPSFTPDSERENPMDRVAKRQRLSGLPLRDLVEQHHTAEEDSTTKSTAGDVGQSEESDKPRIIDRRRARNEVLRQEWLHKKAMSQRSQTHGKSQSSNSNGQPSEAEVASTTSDDTPSASSETASAKVRQPSADSGIDVSMDDRTEKIAPGLKSEPVNAATAGMADKTLSDVLFPPNEAASVNDS